MKILLFFFTHRWKFNVVFTFFFKYSKKVCLFLSKWSRTCRVLFAAFEVRLNEDRWSINRFDTIFSISQSILFHCFFRRPSWRRNEAITQRRKPGLRIKFGYFIIVDGSIWAFCEIRLTEASVYLFLGQKRLSASGRFAFYDGGFVRSFFVRFERPAVFRRIIIHLLAFYFAFVCIFAHCIWVVRAISWSSIHNSLG